MNALQPLYPINDTLNFNDYIFKKKEFHDLQLSGTSLDIVGDDAIKHQEFIKRFMSSHTPYPAILIYHDMGLGKTRTSIYTLEQLRASGEYKRFIIITPNTLLATNYRNELIQVAGDDFRPSAEELEGRPPEYEMRKIKKNINAIYSFETFVSMSKKIAAYTDDQIIKYYSNSAVVIDEVHNSMVDNQYKNINIDSGTLDDYLARIKNNVYAQLFRLLHLGENMKILVMTGTPIRDKAYQIADVLNLILPLEKQLPVGDRFISEYLVKHPDGTHSFNEDRAHEFKTVITGYVSYLKAFKDRRVSLKYYGSPLPITFKDGLVKGEIVYKSNMGKFQQAAYERAIFQDLEEKAQFYGHSTQASLMVFPDSSWGNEGYKKYVRERKSISGILKYRFTPDFLDKFKEDKTNDAKLARLATFSSKYALVIEGILNSPGICFVFSRMVHGSGIIVFSLLLMLFDFSRSVGADKKKKNRFALLSSTIDASAENTQKIIKSINNPRNKFGQYIKVVIGSDSVSEGITIKNCLRMDKLNPDWNNTTTVQSIARGYRLFSHDALLQTLEDVQLSVYKHCSLSTNPKVMSIEEYMYKVSQIKDITNMGVIRKLKEAAVDCGIFYKQNVRSWMTNYSVNCDYMECQYYCNELAGAPPYDGAIDEDLSTFLFYWNDIGRNEITSVVRKLFRTRFHVSFSELRRLLNIKDIMLLFSLKYMIENKIQIQSKYGNVMFLNEYADIYFLTSDYSATDVFQLWYEENLQLSKYIDYKTVWANFYADNLSAIMPKFDSFGAEQKKEMLARAPQFVNELIIENVITAIRSNPDKNRGFKMWILDTFSSFIRIIGDKVIVTYMIDNPEVGARCFTGEWKRCSAAETEEIAGEQKRAIEEVRQIAADIGFYGEFDRAASKFRIRFTDDTDKEDRRKKRRGRVCKTIKKSDLLRAISKTNLNAPADFKREMAKQQLLGEAQSSTFLQKLELANMTIEKLRALLYYQTKTVIELCTIIKDWLEKQNLLK